MISLLGPFGPGRRRLLGENNIRYFRFRSKSWRRSRVEGLRTMAERRKRARRMKRVHKPARITIGGAQVGSALSVAIEDEQLMFD